MADPYPAWICCDCGDRLGRLRNPDCMTIHEGDRCGWCGEEKPTTEPRDYGYPPPPRPDAGAPARRPAQPNNPRSGADAKALTDA